MSDKWDQYEVATTVTPPAVQPPASVPTTVDTANPVQDKWSSYEVAPTTPTTAPTTTETPAATGGDSLYSLENSAKYVASDAARYLWKRFKSTFHDVIPWVPADSPTKSDLEKFSEAQTAREKEEAEKKSTYLRLTPQQKTALKVSDSQKVYNEMAKSAKQEEPTVLEPARQFPGQSVVDPEGSMLPVNINESTTKKLNAIGLYYGPQEMPDGTVQNVWAKPESFVADPKKVDSYKLQVEAAYDAKIAKYDEAISATDNPYAVVGNPYGIAGEVLWHMLPSGIQQTRWGPSMFELVKKRKELVEERDNTNALLEQGKKVERNLATKFDPELGYSPSNPANKVNVKDKSTYGVYDESTAYIDNETTQAKGNSFAFINKLIDNGIQNTYAGSPTVAFTKHQVYGEWLGHSQKGVIEQQQFLYNGAMDEKLSMQDNIMDYQKQLLDIATNAADINSKLVTGKLKLTPEVQDFLESLSLLKGKINKNIEAKQKYIDNLDSIVSTFTKEYQQSFAEQEKYNRESSLSPLTASIVSVISDKFNWAATAFPLRVKNMLLPDSEVPGSLDLQSSPLNHRTMSDFFTTNEQSFQHPQFSGMAGDVYHSASRQEADDWYKNWQKDNPDASPEDKTIAGAEYQSRLQNIGPVNVSDMDALKLYDIDGNFKPYFSPAAWVYQTGKVTAESAIIGGAMAAGLGLSEAAFGVLGAAGGLAATAAGAGINATTGAAVAEGFAGAFGLEAGAVAAEAGTFSKFIPWAAEGAWAAAKYGSAAYVGGAVPSMLLYGDTYIKQALDQGFTYPQAKELGLWQARIEGYTEMIFPNEMHFFKWLVGTGEIKTIEKLGKQALYREIVSKAFEKRFGKVLPKALYDAMYHLGTGGAKALAVSLEEGSEEVIGLAWNTMGPNQLGKEYNALYHPQEEWSINNAYQTMVSTMATMLPMGATQGVRSVKEHLQSQRVAQFMVGRSPATYLATTLELYKSGKIDKNEFDRRSNYINKISDIALKTVAEGNGMTIVKGTQVRLSHLPTEQQEIILQKLYDKNLAASKVQEDINDAVKNNLTDSEKGELVTAYEKALIDLRGFLEGGVFTTDDARVAATKANLDYYISPSTITKDTPSPDIQRLIKTLTTYAEGETNMSLKVAYSNKVDLLKAALVKSQEEEQKNPAILAQRNNAEGKMNLLTARGTKEFKYGVDYYASEHVTSGEDGTQVLHFPVIQIQQDLGDGTVIALVEGNPQKLSKETLAQYSFDELANMTALPKNDIRRIWFDNRNSLMQYKFSAATKTHEHYQLGRLQYDSASNKLFFVYKTKQGVIDRIQVSRKQLTPQKGFSTAKVTFVAAIDDTPESMANKMLAMSGADFTSLSQQQSKRSDALQAFMDVIRKPVAKIESKIADKKKKLDKILSKIEKASALVSSKRTDIKVDELKGILSPAEIRDLKEYEFQQNLEADKEAYAEWLKSPESEREVRVSPLDLVPVLVHEMQELARLKDEISKELEGMELEQEVLMAHFDGEVERVSELLGEIDFNEKSTSYQAVEAYKKELEKAVRDYGKAVVANNNMIQKITDLIDILSDGVRKIIESFQERFPSMGTIPESFNLREQLDALKQWVPDVQLAYFQGVVDNYNKQLRTALFNMQKEQGTQAPYTSEQQILDEAYADLDLANKEKLKLEAMAETMDTYRATIKDLNNVLKSLGKSRQAYDAGRKKTQLEKVKDIINNYFLEYQSNNSAGNPADVKGVPSPSMSKDLRVLFTSTTTEPIYDPKGNLLPDALLENNGVLVRLQNFLNIIKSTENLGLLVITKHNAAKYGLEDIIFTKDTTNKGENENDYDIRVVVVKKRGGDIAAFYDENGNEIEVGKQTKDNVVYTAIPRAKLTWKNGQPNYHTEATTPEGREAEEKLALQLVDVHKNFRKDLLEKSKTEEPHILDVTGVSRGVSRKEENLSTRNPIIGTIIPAGTDLSSTQFIEIPTLKNPDDKTGVISSEMRKDAVNMPIGHPVINTGQHLVFANTRKFTTSEVNKLVKVFIYLYQQARDNEGKLDMRIMAYIHKVLYWRSPDYASKSTKKEQDPETIGVSQMWYDYTDGGIKLGRMDATVNGIQFSFEGDDSANVEALRTFLSNLYHNVDNADFIGTKFEEITDIDLKSKDPVKTQVWNSYQEYLLSDKQADGKTERPLELIPLTTNIVPSAPGEPNFGGRYMNYENPIADSVLSAAPIIIRQNSNPSKTSLEGVVNYVSGDVYADKPMSIYSWRSLVPNHPLSGDRIYEFVDRLSGKGILFIFNKGAKFTLATFEGTAQDMFDTDEEALEFLEDNYKKGSKIEEPLELLSRDLKKGATPTVVNKKVTEELEAKAKETTSSTDAGPKTESEEQIKEEDSSGLNEAVEDAVTPASEDDFRVASKIDKYNLENLDKAKSWLATRFPKIHFRVARGLIKGKAWGQVTKKAIILSDIAEEGTVYHEAFEATYKYLLSSRQIIGLRREFRKRAGSFVDRESTIKDGKPVYIEYKNATNKQIKEQLAEEYRDFEMQGGKFLDVPQRQKKDLFELIWDFIHNFINKLLGNPDTINEVFEKMSNASYREVEPRLNLLNIANTGSDYRLARMNQEDGLFLVSITKSITSLLFDGMFSRSQHISDIFNAGFDLAKEYRNVKSRLDKYYGGKETLELLSGKSEDDFINYFLTNGKYDQDKYNSFTAKLPKSLINRLQLYSAARNFTKGDRIKKLFDVLKAYEYINNNWSELVDYNHEFLQSTYKLVFEEGDKVVEVDEDGVLSEYSDNELSYDAKQNTNSEIKLLIANLIEQDYIGGKDPDMTSPRINDLLLNELVDYNKTIIGLLYKLSDATNFKEMEEIIRENLPYNPEYKGLITRMKLGQELQPGDAAVLDLRNKFYGSMNKMVADADKLIINHNGTSNVQDLNDEKGASLVRSSWLNNLRAHTKTTVNGVRLIRITDSGKLAVNPTALKGIVLKDSKDYKNFLNTIGFTFPLKISKMGLKDIKAFKEATSAIFTILSKTDAEFIVGDSDVLKTPINTLAKLYIKHTNSYAEPQRFNIDRQAVQNILQNNYFGQVIKKFNKSTSIEDLIRRIPQLNTSTAENIDGVNGFHTGSLVISPNTDFFTAAGERRDNGKTIDISLIEGSEIVRSGQGRHSSMLNTADRLAQEFAYNLNGKFYLLTPADTKTEWSVKFGLFVSEILAKNNRYVLDIFRKYLKAEILAVQQFKSSKKAGTIYHRVKNLNTIEEGQTKKNGERLRFFENILGFPLDIPLTSTADEIIAKNSAKIDQAINSWIDRTSKRTKDLFISQGIIRDIPTKSETEGKDRKKIAFMPSDRDNNLTTKEVDELIRFVEINYMINMIEQHKLFWGDPYMWTDVTKRIKSFVSGRMISIANNEDFNKWHNTNSNAVNYVNRDGVHSHVNLRPGDAGFIRYDGKLRTATSKEVKVVSALYETIKAHILNETAKDMIGKEYTSSTITKEEKLKVEKAAAPAYTPYAKIDEADGQGWAFLPGYKEMMQRANLWPPEAEQQYQYEMAYERLARDKYANNNQGEKLKLHDTNLVHIKGDPKSFSFFILKPIYAGLKDGAVFLPHLDKYSLAPVFYRAVENTQFKELYLAHVDAGTHYLKLESTNKVGTLLDENGEIQPFYNPDGTINTKFTSDVLSFDHFGIQVDTEKQKDMTTRGSQLTKLAVMNLLDGGVPIDFIASYDGKIPDGVTDKQAYIEEKWDELSDEEKEDESPVYKLVKENNDVLSALTIKGRDRVFKDFGIKAIKSIDARGIERFSYTFTDFSRVADLLQDELVSRNSPENVKESIRVKKIVGDDGVAHTEFELPFDMIIGGDRVENIINALIDKTISRPKLPGGSKPQMSSTLMEKHRRDFVTKDKAGKWVSVEDISKISKAEQTKAVLTSNELKFYEISEDGRTVTGMEILLPSPFKKKFKNGQSIKFSDLSDELKKGIGFRMPTQALNSVEHFTIKGFLPDAYGDSIIVPSEIVAKAGTDFDIDKLNLYLYNYRVGRGFVEKIPFLNEDNSHSKFRYIAYINDLASNEEKRYIDHLSVPEVRELRESFKDKLAEIKARLKSQGTLQISALKEEQKNEISLINQETTNEKDAYVKELRHQGNLLFRTLPEEVKEEFWAHEEMLDQMGISGASKLLDYDFFASRYTVDDRLSDNDQATIIDMVELYRQERKFFTNSTINDVFRDLKVAEVKRKFAELKSFVSGLVETTFKREKSYIDMIRDTGMETFQFERSEELSKIFGYPSLAQFEAMSFYEQNTQEALENKYIDTLRALLSLPENYRQLVTANTAEALKDLSKRIATLYKEEDEKGLSRYLDRTSNAFTRAAFQVGKMAVAIGAAGVTNHAVNQQVNLGYDRYQEDGTVYPALTFNLNHTLTTDGNRVLSDWYSMSRIRATDGSWISETINAFINAFVDVAKDPFVIRIGGNMDTAGVYLAGVKLGIPLEDLVFWFNQPIIREYMRQKSLHQFSQGAAKAIIARVNNDELYKPAIIGRVAAQFGTADDVPYLPMVKYSSAIQVPERTANFTHAELEGMIKTFMENGKDFTKFTKEEREAQAQLLNQFVYLENISQSLLSFTMGYSWDNKRTPNFDDTRIGFATTQSARKELFGKFINDVFKKTFIGAIFSSKVHVIEAARALFLTETPMARAVLDDMLQPVYYARISREDKEYYAKDIRRAFVTYLLQTTPIEYQGKTIRMSDLIHDLFMSDHNMANRLRAYQKEMQDGNLDANYFLENSQPVMPLNSGKPVGRKGIVHNIKMIQKSSDKQVSDITTIAIANLAKQQSTAKFAEDLLIYAILQSGMVPSRLSFTDLLPNSGLNDIMNEIYYKFKESSAVFNDAGITPSTIAYFKQAYYRNKWNDDRFVPLDTREDWTRVLSVSSEQSKLAGVGPVPDLFKLYVGTTSDKKQISSALVQKNSKLKKDYYAVQFMAIDPATKQTFTNAAIREMVAMRDYSFIETEIYEKVMMYNPESGKMEGVVVEEYNPKRDEYVHVLLYRPVGKLGDGEKITEYYAFDHPSAIHDDIKTASSATIWELATKLGWNPRFLETNYMRGAAPSLEDATEAVNTGDVTQDIDASTAAMLELAGGGTFSYAYGPKTKDINFKRFRPIDVFKRKHDAKLIASGQKTAISIKGNERSGLEIGESGMQTVLGKPVKVTYLGVLTKKEADKMLGQPLEKAEAFDKTPEKEATGLLDKRYLGGKSDIKQHIYKLELIKDKSVEVKELTTTKPITNIDFKQHENSDYPSRTRANAGADATLAFAVDFKTAGERVTKTAVENKKKLYVPIKVPAKSKSSKGFTPDAKTISSIITELNKAKAKSLNIAGNTLDTMLGAKYSQEDIDQYVYKLLKAVVESPDLKNRIESVVTGGQSGVDEAGAKAASRLGLKTTVLAPKGWRYRDEKGEEIRNEKKFKERFSYTTTKKLLIEATPEAKVAKQTERFAVGAAEVLDLDKSSKKGEYFEKDKAKFAPINKLISRGSSNSSSEAYRIAAGKFANTGEYASTDIVGISAEGNRTGRVSPDFVEIKKAVLARATIITDKAADRARQYNVGEREVADFLIKNGYKETSDGQWERDPFKC